MESWEFLVRKVVESSDNGEYRQCFDYIISLAYITSNKKILSRLEKLRDGIEYTIDKRIEYDDLVDLYHASLVKDSNGVFKIVFDDINYEISKKQVIDCMRYCNRIMLISCFEIAHMQGIYFECEI